VRVLVAVAANGAAKVFSATANPTRENKSAAMTARTERHFLNCISVSFLLPNGKAQAQRRDWRDSFSIRAHFWQITPVR